MKKRIKSKVIRVKKVFSTRNDLTNPTISEQFADDYPSIEYDNGKNRIFFEPKEICFKK